MGTATCASALQVQSPAAFATSQQGQPVGLVRQHGKIAYIFARKRFSRHHDPRNIPVFPKETGKTAAKFATHGTEFQIRVTPY